MRSSTYFVLWVKLEEEYWRSTGNERSNQASNFLTPHTHQWSWLGSFPLFMSSRLMWAGPCFFFNYWDTTWQKTTEVKKHRKPDMTSLHVLLNYKAWIKDWSEFTLMIKHNSYLFYVKFTRANKINHCDDSTCTPIWFLFSE